jgi:2-polyprenyl-3-methyl-5-hydroxy-6-metoxy-1,4-benzoquinol methylase
MPRLEALDARYREHQKQRDEFVFGSNERASIIAELVGGAELRVLDLGCRTGALTQHFAKGNRVTGLDVDHEALARARDRLGIETVWGNVEEGLPFADDSFDVVVAGELLEHLAMPKSVVRDVRRVLAPGGRFVGSVPNAFRLKSRLRFAAGRHPETDPTHLQLFTPAALRAMLSDFVSVELRFAVGRYVRLHPRLMARSMIFSARTAAASTP